MTNGIPRKLLEDKIAGMGSKNYFGGGDKRELRVVSFNQTNETNDMKVFISTTTFAKYSDEPLKLLKNARVNHSLNPHNRKLNEHEIKEILKNNNYEDLIAGTEPLTRDVLKEARSLNVISGVGVGIDNIDLEAARESGIKVFYTPEAPTDAVAEFTIDLILNALRHLNLMDSNIRNGIWNKKMGLLFRGKALGIIGFGRIGKRVAEIAKSFGVDVVFSDVQKIETPLAKRVSLEELLNSSDIVTIHASGKNTIISEKEIEQMKDGAILINAARGGMVDEEALYDALVSGKISYAAIDTFTKEPYKGKLSELENVILTPHIGSYAKEARIRMEIEAVENLIKGLFADGS